MATGTAVWTENQTDVNFGDLSPADGVQTEADFDLATAGYDRIVIQVSIDWNGSATDWADLNLYNSANSGGQNDTTPIWSQRLTALANDPEYITVIIDGIPYAILELDNQSNQEIAALDLIYAGRKWDIS